MQETVFLSVFRKTIGKHGIKLKELIIKNKTLVISIFAPFVTKYNSLYSIYLQFICSLRLVVVLPVLVCGGDLA